MNLTSSKSQLSTILALLITVPLIAYFILFSIKRHSEFEPKAEACQQKCTDEGYLKSEFKWSAFSGEDCQCSMPQDE